MTTPEISTPEELDEYRARAMFASKVRASRPNADDDYIDTAWKAFATAPLDGACFIEEWLTRARAIRHADEALGIPTEALLALIRGEAVVVPKKLTDAMVAAATEALNAPRMCVGSVKHQKVNDLHVGHRAMLAASPYAKQGEK